MLIKVIDLNGTKCGYYTNFEIAPVVSQDYIDTSTDNDTIYGRMKNISSYFKNRCINIVYITKSETVDTFYKKDINDIIKEIIDLYVDQNNTIIMTDIPMYDLNCKKGLEFLGFKDYQIDTSLDNGIMLYYNDVVGNWVLEIAGKEET